MAGPLPRKKPRQARERRARVTSAPVAVPTYKTPDGMLPIPDLDKVSVVFGDVKHMPKYEDIPEQFTRHHGPFVEAVSTWFFSGAKREGNMLIVKDRRFVAKPGVDASKALRAIQAVLGSFAPKHEHKEAACAYMLSEWFELQP